MELTPNPGGAKALLQCRLPNPSVGLAWLGQAGFLVRHAGLRLLIDPYLSNYLGRKYTGKEFSHERMMPPPVEAGEIRELDMVLCSHRHGDHVDPDTLNILARNNPRCRFVVPRAELGYALQIGLDEARLIGTNDGETVRVDDSTDISVIASAHEALVVNEKGEHHFLGFILRFDGVAVYHSGDSLVYDGLTERLRPMGIKLALLPVNGRSERLSSRGIVGNMTFTEARDLCLAAGIGLMVPHHFGMFSFNTVDPVELEKQIARVDRKKLQCVVPEADRYYVLA
jgi:L-ascorbate metabolism protein UlaG (beta-lactamase superfamily)